MARFVVICEIMFKKDPPNSSGFGKLPEEDRVIMRRPPAPAGAANSGFGNSGFGGSSLGNSGFGTSGFGNSNFGPSGIVPTGVANMPTALLGLVYAMRTSESPDAFKLTLGVAQWEVLEMFLQPFSMEPGQLLVEQGAKDTTVYLIEAGTLNVFSNDGSGQRHVAMVGAGTVVGEGAFFSRAPRNATVQAASRCRLWSLSPMRFTELSNRHAPVALSFAMALGAVVARRMNGGQPKRAAVT